MADRRLAAAAAALAVVVLVSLTHPADGMSEYEKYCGNDPNKPGCTRYGPSYNYGNQQQQAQAAATTAAPPTTEEEPDSDSVSLSEELCRSNRDTPGCMEYMSELMRPKGSGYEESVDLTTVGVPSVGLPMTTARMPPPAPMTTARMPPPAPATTAAAPAPVAPSEDVCRTRFDTTPGCGEYMKELYRIRYQNQNSGPPSGGLPSVSLPSVGFPSISLPSVGLPSVGLPSVSLPLGYFPGSSGPGTSGSSSESGSLRGPCTRYGNRCVSPCALETGPGATGSYHSCKYNTNGNWDWCSPAKGRSISVWSDHCISECSQKQGEDYKYYFWCLVPGGTWDYCSPHKC